MLNHYVVFKPHTGREAELSRALEEFANKIRDLPCVLELTWGENVNASGLAHGFTPGCYGRLSTMDALKGEYWNHPAHQALLAILDTVREDRFALDYTVGGAE